jgi:hypothetical protein
MADVTALAKLLGWKVFHQWLSIRSESGWPDLTLVRPPRLVFAELKTERGKLTLAQDQTLDLLVACGAEVYVWRPYEWDEVVQTLKRGQDADG